ncbi:hypothetical protein [Streptomyces sp. NPDC005148]
MVRVWAPRRGLSDGIITLSPLRLDDVEAHLKGEELLARHLDGGPGTREGIEAYFRHASAGTGGSPRRWTRCPTKSSAPNRPAGGRLRV